MTTGTITIRHPLISSITLLLLAIATSSWAGPYEVWAGSPKVPGTDELESGQVNEAIEKLEAQLGTHEPDWKGSVLTTLCAAYIVKGELELATSTCEEAVEYDRRAAYNNRGVLRAIQGDVDGAERDFAKAARIPTISVERVLSGKDRYAIRENRRNAQRQLAARQREDTRIAEGAK